jgi:hypothetical protein
MQHEPDLLTETTIRQNTHDAAAWRALQAELTARGYENTSLFDILSVFPDFTALSQRTTPASTLDTTTPTPQWPPNAFLDGFLTRSPAAPSLRPPLSIQAAQPVNVREFAEAETTLGNVSVGYTDTGMLAFTFEANNETYLVPVSEILTMLITSIVARRPVWNKPRRKSNGATVM